MSDKAKDTLPPLDTNTDDVVRSREEYAQRKPDWDWKAIFDKISSMLDGLVKAFSDPEGFAIWKKANGWSAKPKKEDWDREPWDPAPKKEEVTASTDSPVKKEELSMKKVSEEAREEFNFAAAGKPASSSNDISPDIGGPFTLPAPGGIKNNAA